MDEETAQFTQSHSHSTHWKKWISNVGCGFILSICPVGSITFHFSDLWGSPLRQKGWLHKSWVLIRVNLPPTLSAKISQFIDLKAFHSSIGWVVWTKWHLKFISTPAYSWLKFLVFKLDKSQFKQPLLSRFYEAGIVVVSGKFCLLYNFKGAIFTEDSVNHHPLVVWIFMALET